MSKLVLFADDKEQEVPDAGWQSGLVMRKGDKKLGVGLVLYDEQEQPIAGVHMNARQALEHAAYFFTTAMRMVGLSDAPAAYQMAREMLGHVHKAMTEQAANDKAPLPHGRTLN